jgi:hypothetical protein
MRVDLGSAVRAKDGRRCWVNGEAGLMALRVRVDSMRCEAAGALQAWRRVEGRMSEAIVAGVELCSGAERRRGGGGVVVELVGWTTNDEALSR